MSDLSTREQIRATAIERLARSEYEYDASVDFRPGWEKLPADVRERYRIPATRAVDALGDLLPTEIRCVAVRSDYEDFDDIDHEVVTTRAAAAKELESWGAGGKLVGYYRTDWIEVTE